MSTFHRPFPRTLFLSALAAAAIGAAAPAAAVAADAPLRTISIDPSGAVLTGFTPVAISPDGREVLATMPTQTSNQIVIRNVAAGTTTAVLGAGDIPLGASTDLQKVLFQTTAWFSAKDTNGLADLYLWNRQTGTKTLVSRDASGNAIGADPYAGSGPGFTFVTQASLSGNGNVVEFGEAHGPAADSTTQNYTFDQWRLDLSAGTLTKVADAQQPVDALALDDAGKVAVTRGGFYVGTKRFDLPYDASAWNVHVRISPDGSAAVVWSPAAPLTAYVVDLTTGAKRTLTLPSWVNVPGGFNIWAVTNGGTRVLMSTILDRGQGSRSVFGWMEQSGSLAQYGPDVPLTSSRPVVAVSSNFLFAATPTHLAQLGTTALPGTEPVVTFTPTVSDYVSIVDSQCTQNFWYVTYSRPTVKLGGAVGADLRTPVSAQVTVTKTSTKQVVNSFTLTPKAPNQDLLTGKNGNFTATIHLKLSDGTVLDGTEVVAPHGNPECPPLVL